METNRNKRKRATPKGAKAPDGSGYLVLRGKNYQARWKVNGKIICRSLHTSDRETAKAELARLSVPRTGLRDRDAMMKLTRAMSAQLSDVSDQVRAASIPIKQLFDIWQQSPIRGRATGRTLESYRHQLTSFTDWLSGVYPEITNARDVSQTVAEEYITHRRNTRSPGTVQKDLNLLSAIWKSLALKFGLEYNPWHPDRIARPAAKPVSRRALTDMECQALLDTANATQRLRILLALDAGLRLGDIIHLEWRFIDFDRRIINALPTRKTGAEIFNPISERLKAALLEHRAKQPQDEPHVFPDDLKRLRTNGDPESITHEMKILFERAGIETTQTDKNGKAHTVASFHSLRHTFVSRLMERGVNPYYVQRAVGHSTMMMTAHYDHSAAEEIRKALDIKTPRSKKHELNYRRNGKNS